MPLFRARLSKNLDPIPAHVLVFRRVGIVVDAHFADSFFRRHLTVRETIDLHCRATAVLSLHGTAHRLQGCEQSVRIIRQSLQIATTQHHRVGVSI